MNPSGRVSQLSCPLPHVCLGLLLGVLAGSALGCSRAPNAGARGDANNPIPVRIFSVEEEVLQRNVQTVGSLYALEESTIPYRVEVVDLTEASPAFRERVRREGIAWTVSASA